MRSCSGLRLSALGLIRLVQFLFAAAVYTGIGAAIYIWAYGEPSGFTVGVYALMFAWPLVLIGWVFWYLLIVVVVIIAVLVGFSALDGWLARRR